MSNPILDMLGKQTPPAARTPQLPPQFQSLKQSLSMLKMARNPQAFANQLVSQNPALQQAAQYVQQNGGDYKAAAQKLAQEKGVNLNQMLNAFRI